MRVMTEKVQALFEKANEGLTDRPPEICGIYGRACHEMGRNPSRMPCLHCPLAKFLDEAKRIIPREGVVYENRNGWWPPPPRRTRTTPPRCSGSAMGGP